MKIFPKKDRYPGYFGLLIRFEIYKFFELTTRPLMWTTDNNWHQGWWPTLKRDLRCDLLERMSKWVWRRR